MREIQNMREPELAAGGRLEPHDDLRIVPGEADRSSYRPADAPRQSSHTGDTGVRGILPEQTAEPQKFWHLGGVDLPPEGLPGCG